MSGVIQRLAGMKKFEGVVAINDDPGADLQRRG